MAGGATCPVCSFELLAFCLPDSRCFPLCPYCFNNPQVERLAEATAAFSLCPKTALLPLPHLVPFHALQPEVWGEQPPPRGRAGAYGGGAGARRGRGAGKGGGGLVAGGCAECPLGDLHPAVHDLAVCGDAVRPNMGFWPRSALDAPLATVACDRGPIVPPPKRATLESFGVPVAARIRAASLFWSLPWRVAGGTASASSRPGRPLLLTFPPPSRYLINLAEAWPFAYLYVFALSATGTLVNGARHLCPAAEAYKANHNPGSTPTCQCLAARAHRAAGRRWNSLGRCTLPPDVHAARRRADAPRGFLGIGPHPAVSLAPPGGGAPRRGRIGGLPPPSASPGP